MARKKPKRSPADEAAKQRQLALAREQIYEAQPAIIAAMIKIALGSVHLMKRDEYGSGKFERITDPDEAWAILNNEKFKEGTHFTLATKDPSVQAADLLLAYALDTPRKPPDALGVTGTLKILWD